MTPPDPDEFARVVVEGDCASVVIGNRGLVLFTPEDLKRHNTAKQLAEEYARPINSAFRTRLAGEVRKAYETAAKMAYPHCSLGRKVTAIDDGRWCHGNFVCQGNDIRKKGGEA